MSHHQVSWERSALQHGPGCIWGPADWLRGPRARRCWINKDSQEGQQARCPGPRDCQESLGSQVHLGPPRKKKQDQDVSSGKERARVPKELRCPTVPTTLSPPGLCMLSAGYLRSPHSPLQPTPTDHSHRCDHTPFRADHAPTLTMAPNVTVTM